MPFQFRAAVLAAFACFLAGCSQLPNSGPLVGEVEQASQQAAEAGAKIQVVDVTDAVARALAAVHHSTSFSEALGETPAPETLIGAGDLLQVTLWEAPPATLFATTGPTQPGVPSTTLATALPEQPVDLDGTIAVPFVGRVPAAGLTARALGDKISQGLAGKANHPEVLVRITSNRSSMVTVVGEFNNSLRMPLTGSRERLLDALAAAGGVRQPVGKTTIQVTRGDHFYTEALDRVIRDPHQNVPLRSGDVVTAMYQPLSFMALGATGKQDEISFEAQGVTLAQALARASGMLDNRASAEGVFVFRLESPTALAWPHQPVSTTPDGLVPVIYHLDLRDPRSFFVMQSFAMNDKDVLYVSNAPTAQLQKFLNLLFTLTYPLVQLNNAVN